MRNDARDETDHRGGGLTALLLAGSRPGTDPLASAFGVATKALVPLAGEPMLGRSARALLGHPAVGRLIVLGQDADALADHPQLGWLREEPRVTFESGGDSVSAAVLAALDRHPAGYPFLVTTADHGLLDAEMIEAFLGRALAAEADVAVAVVEKRVLHAAYPDNRRTWLRFRGGSYSGANLFLLTSPGARPALALWRTIEQQRKRGRAIVAAFGPLMLAAVGLRLLTLQGALGRAGRRLGLRAVAVELPIAEACIDVDTPADHVLATAILARRGAADPTIPPQS